MVRTRPLLFLAAALAISGSLRAAADEPDLAQQAGIIAAMRENALAFDRNLPNFICSQLTHREMRREPDLALGVRSSGSGRQAGAGVIQSGGTGQWEPLDNYEQQLSYFDHREKYLLVKKNGKRAGKGEDTPGGFSSSGEFGSTLTHIFEAESMTDFEWKRADTLRGHQVYVFTFKIAKEHSAVQLTAADQTVVVGYHGLLYSDRDTKAIMRVTTEAEIPPDFPLQGVTHILDYGQFTIGDSQYLLPLHAEVQSRASEEFMRTGRTGGNSKQASLRNTVDFSGYRKYSAEATLKPE